MYCMWLLTVYITTIINSYSNLFLNIQIVQHLQFEHVISKRQYSTKHNPMNALIGFCLSNCRL